jgi:D-alanyl-D-alanine carboxypeptidase
MNTRVIIRPAGREDHEAVCRLRTEALLETPQNPAFAWQSRIRAGINPADILLDRVLDGCVLVGEAGGRIVACNSLDLDGAAMEGLYVSPALQRQGIGRRMVTAVERLAVRFGMARLRAEVPPSAVAFFTACRYRPRSAVPLEETLDGGIETLPMQRAFPRRQTRYGARIGEHLRQLGIAADYGRRHRLQLQVECSELAAIGHDTGGREQFLQPETAMAWYDLRNAAAADGIVLLVASGFRSVDYQATIIERKLRAGQSLAQILGVSAAPGYSEHHTGRAMDLTTPGTRPLEEDFETTPAFEWLAGAAEDFGFRMSYPRNNRHGIAYEPWHWMWTG